MEKLKIAICDDEKPTLDLLDRKTRDLLARKDLDANIRLFTGGAELAREYETDAHPFDVILLDIKMDGPDGIETAKRIREKDDGVYIVFITSSAEYVFRGYEVKAFRYLMKTELEYGFDRVLSDTIREISDSAQTFFTFQFGNEKMKLDPRLINYFESSKRVVRIALDRENYKTYAKLDDIEPQLGGMFVRCHQSYLVNVSRIEKLSPTEILLKNGETLPVSKKHRKAVGDAYLWTMR
ncbi:MAG: response regulator transcription factor [Clostridia bacterium]|nr:response regulator transcription factor [Clostridia bacterium]